MSFGRHPKPPRPSFRPPGPGGQDFAHVSNSGGAIAVLNEGTNVSFPSFQYIGEAITINSTNDQLRIEHPGNYYIAYSLNTTSSLKRLSTRILINGRPVNATTIASERSTISFNNQIILPLEVGDTISLQLFGVVGVVTLLSGAGASLTIFRVH